MRIGRFRFIHTVAARNHVVSLVLKFFISIQKYTGRASGLFTRANSETLQENSRLSASG